MVSQVSTGGMQVDQAVFASSDRGSVKGYQLVGQSAGVASADALELNRWAPTQLPDDTKESGIISCWTLSSGVVVVARTVSGGPEYSNRGGVQVVTSFLLLRGEQFRQYHCNAIAVFRTSFAMGYLRLPYDLHVRRLPEALLPDGSLFAPPDVATGEPRSGDRRFIAESMALIRSSTRFAVSGLDNPIDTVESLIVRMPIDQRQRFSFTTGLWPSIRRPLQAHFYRRPNVARQQTLESQEIVCLH